MSNIENIDTSDSSSIIESVKRVFENARESFEEQ